MMFEELYKTQKFSLFEEKLLIVFLPILGFLKQLFRRPQIKF
ncbi:unnamed protein product [Brassica oleracea]|uniref:(rape) hypothetical protein n=1 Tax=Brassica napus TaxID=3708 RepID=A0A816KYZ3_BRANA|nr:unnamed protein product [Brassica napus]